MTKDGTVVEKIVERTVTKEDEKKTTDTDTKRDGTSDHSKSIVTTLRPNWRVGVLVGASFQAPLLPISGPLVIGAEAQYRIAGGLWAGLWTLPQHGAIGVSVSFEF